MTTPSKPSSDNNSSNNSQRPTRRAPKQLAPYYDPTHPPFQASPYIRPEWNDRYHQWRITLTPKGRNQLRAIFPTTRNDELPALLGVPTISSHTIIRLAHKMKLKKTPEFMHQCSQAAAAKAYTINIAFGLYESRRGHHIPGCEKHQFRTGETLATRYGEERARAILQQAQAARARTVRRERLRILSGEPQQTRLRLTRATSGLYTARYRLLRVYHYLPIDPTEIAPTTFTWDKHTRRSPLCEERYTHRHHFRFIPPQEDGHTEFVPSEP